MILIILNQVQAHLVANVARVKILKTLGVESLLLSHISVSTADLDGLSNSYRHADVWIFFVLECFLLWNQSSPSPAPSAQHTLSNHRSTTLLHLSYYHYPSTNLRSRLCSPQMSFTSTSRLGETLTFVQALDRRRTLESQTITCDG